MTLPSINVLGRVQQFFGLRQALNDQGHRPTTGTEDSSLCIEASTIIRQSSYPTASGGLGDVYKCTRNRDTGSDEVAVKSPRFGDLSETEATKINKACQHGLNLPYA
ncbi:hypothetical protein AZE42_10011 [Rhizopogon vesiculosus]|uniref:Protein kinase domain-containing protein n=1 Tax=Rhizopogon vesiculosus TaxID=180088 RepID=A0A1J8QZG0_9AGAM|nr:hypothetical protein AZE42_10011 [Rhizopogon vesiculosus]